MIYARCSENGANGKYCVRRFTRSDFDFFCPSEASTSTPIQEFARELLAE